MIVDLLIISVITISIINCFKIGFAISLFNSASTVAAAILIIIFNKPFTVLLKNSSIGKSYHSFLIEYATDKVSQNTSNLADGLPSFMNGLVEEGMSGVYDTALSAADKIFEITVTVVAFILLILIVKLITLISPAIIRKIVRLPIIKQFDKLFGAALGFVMGLVWALIAVYAVGLVSLWEPLAFLDSHIANSFFIDAIHTLGWAIL